MQAPNHSTATFDGDGFVDDQMISVGMTAKIKCNERAKIMGNGSDFVVCRRDGTYSSLGRSLCSLVLYLCYMYWDLRASVNAGKRVTQRQRFRLSVVHFWKLPEVVWKQINQLASG